jgi:hypothetical protein
VSSQVLVQIAFSASRPPHLSTKGAHQGQSFWLTSFWYYQIKGPVKTLFGDAHSQFLRENDQKLVYYAEKGKYASTSPYKIFDKADGL